MREPPDRLKINFRINFRITRLFLTLPKRVTHIPALHQSKTVLTHFLSAIINFYKILKNCKRFMGQSLKISSGGLNLHPVHFASIRLIIKLLL